MCAYSRSENPGGPKNRSLKRKILGIFQKGPGYPPPLRGGVTVLKKKPTDNP